MASAQQSSGAASVADVPESPHFRYAGGELCVDGVALSSIAEQFGTPCYVYSGASIDAAYAGIDGALSGVPHLVAYAVKANGNLSILSRLARAGAGADIVSGGELARALKAGFPPDRIVFSGVGKRSDEIRTALETGVRSIHAESEQEIDDIERIARDLGRPAPLSLRINPHVDAQTHPYIATGLASSKFGIDIPHARRLLPRLIASEHLRLEGLAIHIGSMVLAPEPIGEATEIAASFARECIEAGAPLTTVDAGGGWPILYGDEGRTAASHQRFGQTVLDAVARGAGRDHRLTVLVEPGRAVVGDAGVLLSRVTVVKQQGDKRFVVVDAAMTELIRPALYGAYHGVMAIDESTQQADKSPADLVGPVCESGDFLARERPLPPLERGALVAVRGAGAYAAAMASNYNARPLAAEVMVEGGEARLIRRRQAVESLWRDEIM